jgi:hypothetical protein
LEHPEAVSIILYLNHDGKASDLPVACPALRNNSDHLYPRGVRVFPVFAEIDGGVALPPLYPPEAVIDGLHPNFADITCTLRHDISFLQIGCFPEITGYNNAVPME